MNTQDDLTHASFTVERSYAVPPADVFAAFGDPDAKRRWMVEGEGFEVEAYDPGFGLGAFERSSFRFRGGPIITNDTVYLDVVADERLIFAYSMTFDGQPMSSSLVTVRFEAAGTGTRLILTEQGAYLPGYDDVSGRERGMRELLDALAREVEPQPA